MANGWQYFASSNSESYFRRTFLLADQPAAARAHLRSHSGRNAGSALSGTPTAKEYTLPAHRMRILLLERLRLPLPLTEAHCEGCGEVLDAHGRHRASCPTTGRLRTRATPVERTTARIFREAGARVRPNALLRDMNVGVAAGDNRRIEVLAQDLPCYSGAQLAVDVTLRGALSANGEARPRAADEDGAVLEQAREDKETTYPELAASRLCRLVVLAIETGGRWRRGNQCGVSWHSRRLWKRPLSCGGLSRSVGTAGGPACCPRPALPHSPHA